MNLIWSKISEDTFSSDVAQFLPVTMLLADGFIGGSSFLSWDAPCIAFPFFVFGPDLDSTASFFSKCVIGRAICSAYRSRVFSEHGLSRKNDFGMF